MNKAIILAAGRGSRMKGFTEDKPKCLNKVAGRALIDIQLAALRGGGIDDIVVVTGYMSEMIAIPNVRYFRNQNWEKTNMVRSLLCASSEFVSQAIVSYADIIYEKNTVRRLSVEDKDIVIAYDPDWYSLWQARFENPLMDAESFAINKEGRITDIGRKVKNISEIQGQYTGLMKFSEKAFGWITDYVKKQPTNIADKMDMTTLLRSLIGEGFPVYGMPIVGAWCEVDFSSDLKIASRLCEEGKLKINQTT